MPCASTRVTPCSDMSEVNFLELLTEGDDCTNGFLKDWELHETLRYKGQETESRS